MIWRPIHIPSVAFLVVATILQTSSSAAVPSSDFRDSGRGLADTYKVELEDSAVVKTEWTYLSDLLPDAASEELRIIARQVLVATSPLPGRDRVLTHTELESAISSLPELNAHIKTPQVVVLHRWSRSLTQADVLHLLNATAPQACIRFSRLLSENDVRILGEVEISEDSPRLELEAVVKSVFASAVYLKISIRSEPSLPSFWVEIYAPFVSLAPGDLHASICGQKFKSDLSSANALSARKARANLVIRKILPGQIENADAPLTAIVVQVGQPVQVVAHSNGMEISTTATPLAAGHRGDTIRVRSLDNGRVFSGVVVGSQKVEVRF